MRDLLDKRLMIVTGRAGGQSTIALDAGMAAAARGKRTIACEVSAQEASSRVFYRAEAGSRSRWRITCGRSRSLGRGDPRVLPDPAEGPGDALICCTARRSSANSPPNAGTLGAGHDRKIWELTLDQRKVKGGRNYDLVIVDALATGHGVGFLQTPRTFANVARVGPIATQAETLDRHTTTAAPASPSSPPPRRCP